MIARHGDRHRALGRAGAARHVRDLVRAAVLADPTTELLASEIELMKQAGTGRAVLRQALNALVDSRLITRTRGVGTSVESPLPQIDISEYHGSRPDGSPTWIPEVNAEVINWTTVEAPELLAARMGVDPGDPCLCIDYVTWWRGTPYAVSTHYIREAEAHGLERDTLRTDWYPFLSGAGVEIAQTTIVWQAVRADQFDAAALDIEVGDPVLASDGAAYTPDGAVFSVSFVRARGDSVRVHSSQRLIP